MKISKTFSFEAAHHLPNYEGSCSRKHGHHYVLEVILEGEVDEKTGMLVDFNLLQSEVEMYVIDKYDHQDLNDFFPNPTAEEMVKVIGNELDLLTDLPISEVRLWETPNSYAIWNK